MSASFVLGANTLTFSSPPLRPQYEAVRYQAEGMTSGARRLVDASRLTETVFALEWPRMHVDDKDALLTWFASIADGMANAFIYWDALGNGNEVRFADNVLSGITEITPDRFSVRFRLVLSASVDAWMDDSGDVFVDDSANQWTTV